jgi:hypothetical protein
MLVVMRMEVFMLLGEGYFMIIHETFLQVQYRWLALIYVVCFQLTCSNSNSSSSSNNRNSKALFRLLQCLVLTRCLLQTWGWQAHLLASFHFLKVCLYLLLPSLLPQWHRLWELIHHSLPPCDHQREDCLRQDYRVFQLECLER